MKLIMERWSQFLDEASMDWRSLDPEKEKHYQAIFNLKANPMSPDFAKIKKLKDTAMRSHILRNKETKKEPSLSAGSSKSRALYQPKRGKIEQDLYNIGKERSVGSHAFRNAVNNIANFGMMIADPTAQFGGFEDSEEGGKKAVSSIELFKRSREDYKKDPSLFNGAMVALSGLAFIPLLGGGAKAVRAAAKVGMKPAAVKKVVTDAAAISKEIKALPAIAQTDELSGLAAKIDHYTEEISNLKTSRTSSFLNHWQKQINRSVLGKLRKNEYNIADDISAAKPISFRPSGAGLKRSEVRIVDVRIAKTSRAEPFTKGSYHDGRVTIDLFIPETATVRRSVDNWYILEDKRVLSKVSDALSKTGYHEFIHGVQKSGDRFQTQKYISPPRNQADDASKKYLQYRNQADEIEPMALMNRTSPSDITKRKPDTLDKFATGLSHQIDSFEELLATITLQMPSDASKALGRHLKFKEPVKWNSKYRASSEGPKAGVYRSKAQFGVLLKQIRQMRKSRPCSAISAYNAYLLWQMGLYSISTDAKSMKQNPKIKSALALARSGNPAARVTPVPIDPAACGYKSLREWQEAEELKQIILEEIRNTLAKC